MGFCKHKKAMTVSGSTAQLLSREGAVVTNQDGMVASRGECESDRRRKVGRGGDGCLLLLLAYSLSVGCRALVFHLQADANCLHSELDLRPCVQSRICPAFCHISLQRLL